MTFTANDRVSVIFGEHACRVGRVTDTLIRETIIDACGVEKSRRIYWVILDGNETAIPIRDSLLMPESRK